MSLGRCFWVSFNCELLATSPWSFRQRRISLGTRGHRWRPKLCVVPAFSAIPTPGNRTMFLAPSRYSLDRAHKAAIVPIKASVLLVQGEVLLPPEPQ